MTHHSAALLHGLPMPIDCPRFVSLTTDRTPPDQRGAHPGPAAQRRPAARARHAAVASLAVTTPGRTVIDCLRELSLPDAVAVADAAVRGG